MEKFSTYLSWIDLGKLSGYDPGDNFITARSGERSKVGIVGVNAAAHEGTHIDFRTHDGRAVVADVYQLGEEFLKEVA